MSICLTYSQLFRSKKPKSFGVIKNSMSFSLISNLSLRKEHHSPPCRLIPSFSNIQFPPVDVKIYFVYPTKFHLSSSTLKTQTFSFFYRCVLNLVISYHYKKRVRKSTLDRFLPSFIYPGTTALQ